MALPNSFLVSWWYTPDTRLGIYFNSFGLGDSTDLVAGTDPELTGGRGLDYTNGMGCSVNEDYQFENLITNHPVENTAAISDHIIPQPRVITVTGIITSLRPLFLSVDPLELESPMSFSQLGSATELLIKLYESNKGISLLTGLLYGSRYLRVDNLVVQSLHIPRNNAYGRTSLKFTMVLKQIIITSKNGTITPASFSQATAADGVDIL